jgi:hypothetical protein
MMKRKRFTAEFKLEAFGQNAGLSGPLVGAIGFDTV